MSDKKGSYNFNAIEKKWQEHWEGNKTFAATLQVRDIFRTGKFEFTSEGTGFYNHREFTRKSPSVTMTISYNFNNYKPERDRDRNRNQENDEDDDDF